MTLEQNIGAAIIALEGGTGIGLNFIWGLPGDSENLSEIMPSVLKKRKQNDQLRINHPVTLNPGSPLYDEVILSIVS